eukprot:m.20848 g.20848  ORF g.20848 m.20848 type:complete len:58 (-) comp6287_c0_seq1:182-355(-)
MNSNNRILQRVIFTRTGGMQTQPHTVVAWFFRHTTLALKVNMQQDVNRTATNKREDN